ncbi:hypothetical protein KKA14_18345, partial [bacterium]|nr:hypothetical protein [bacterium]
GGLIGSYMSTNYTGDIYREHYSYGFSLEGDAQFVLDNDWSFLPFLMLSIERAQDDENGIISNSGAGFQVRYWKGDKYIGGNIGFYLEIVDYEAGSPSTRYGPGIGLSVGMENINGMIVGLQIDQPMIFSAVETRYTMRLHIGKRWK